MAAFNGRYVIAPGYQDSDAGHWQTRWQAEFGPEAVRVAVSSWDEPGREDWVAGLDAAMTPGAVVVAHSLGCLAALEWLARHPGVAAGAFLVAVPDPEGADFPAAISGFGRPHEPLVEPMLMVGSSDDPYAGWDYTVATAATIGASLVALGPAGHISTASGRGPWPEGRALLAGFLAGLPS
jgi:predicted alpha/beta hydrolase family esterase